MPTQRLSMRRIREVLRMRHQGLTERVIARTLGVSNGVVHGYVRRARLAGLSWPLPEGMDDEGVELLLFPAPTAASQSERRPAPDWLYVEKELRRRSVTRLLLWEEYRAANPDGFGYTWFCTTFEAWKKRVRPTGLALLITEQTFQEQACIRRNTLLPDQRTYPMLNLSSRRRPQRMRLLNRRCPRPRSPDHGCP